jgi:uncharacterized iron-regulated protein
MTVKQKKWKASLETDLMEFCWKEGIPIVSKKRSANDRLQRNLGYLLNRVYKYGPPKVKTVKNLMELTKDEFDYCINCWISRVYRKEDRDKYWHMISGALKRHGFRMYVKGKRFD